MGADRALALDAVRQHGEALEYVADELRADRELVLQAVMQHGCALRHAAEELRADRQIVFEAAICDGSAIQFACDDVRLWLGGCCGVRILADKRRCRAGDSSVSDNIKK